MKAKMLFQSKKKQELKGECVQAQGTTDTDVERWPAQIGFAHAVKHIGCVAERYNNSELNLTGAPEQSILVIDTVTIFWDFQNTHLTRLSTPM
jgi:hypothetical protein